jgi:glycosyltransferase involved in cell wall biosynthesis
MKITYIVPGSGGTFYCGNCLRDCYFTDTLRDTGHDITVIPMYLPLNVDHFEADTPIFYGAVNLYLQQMIPFMKKLPKFLKNFFDSKGILQLAAKRSGSTDPTGLEDMTISMLKGEEGDQKEDLDMLINWLRNHEKPDIIHLSNALLTGLAKRLKEDVGCKVICTLQDEDEWIDEMKEPFKSESWKLIEMNAEYIDGFISVSNFYADLIRQRINIPKEKISVVYNSICKTELNNKGPINGHTIGYMSKINSSFGADILLDAFLLLKKDERFKDLKLSYTGGYVDDYKKIVKYIKRKAKANRIEKDVIFFNDISMEGKKKFLDSISVMCVPARREGAFGIYLLEAFANGIPSVMPDHGAYPEIINSNGAGILYKPNDPENLAMALESIIGDEEKYQQLKANCHDSIKNTFNNKTQVGKIIEIYEKCLS